MLAGGLDIVLHNQEVSGETHRFHDVELEVYTLLGFCVKRVAIALLCPFIGEFCQIVGFEFDAIEFVVASEFLDFVICVFF